MDTLEQAHSSTFYQQNMGNSNSHPQSPLNAGDYAATPVLKQPDHLNPEPEDVPRLMERAATILAEVEAVLSAHPYPLSASETSCHTPPNGSDPNALPPDALPPDIEAYNPPPEKLAAMIAHLEKLFAEAIPAASVATSGQYAPQYDQTATRPLQDSAGEPRETLPNHNNHEATYTLLQSNHNNCQTTSTVIQPEKMDKDQLPAQQPSVPNQPLEPLPVKRGRPRGKSGATRNACSSDNLTSPKPYNFRSRKTLKGMLKDGQKTLYRSLMAMLMDTTNYGDAVTWIDKAKGIFEIHNKRVFTERLTGLCGNNYSRHPNVLRSMRYYQKEDQSGMLLPSRIVRTGEYEKMSGVFQWNLAHDRVAEIMATTAERDGNCSAPGKE